MNWQEWEKKFEIFIQAEVTGDAAHDVAHVWRVVNNARRFAKAEGALLEIVIPAAWLHDCVVVPKNSPQRSKASQMAADVATQFLSQQNYPPEYLEAIAHAILAHSFSAGVAPTTLEAKVVQDADRLDALGAIGVARCFTLGGVLGRPLYHSHDPFCHNRVPHDTLATVDHFYTKLLTLVETMHTPSGRQEAWHRTQFMFHFLKQLREELETD